MPLLDLHVGRPVTRGALSLFPVWSSTAVARRGYDLRTADVAVSELPSGPSVPHLMVTNAGRRPLLVLEGELLHGGHQHRVAAQTVLVPAQAQLGLEVRCVEQGRWRGSSQHVRTGHRAPVRVRAASARGQHDAWQAVAAYEAEHGRNDTSSLLDAIGDVEQAAARLVQGLRPLPFQSGVLFGVAGQPLLLEVFDSPRTLEHAWEALVRSAAVDAVGLSAVPTPGRRARRFLERVDQVPLRAPEPVGAGVQARGQSPYVHLSVTGWRERIVHATAVNLKHQLVSVRGRPCQSPGGTGAHLPPGSPR